MYLKRTVAPTKLPVTVEYIIQNSRLSEVQPNTLPDFELIQGMIEAATQTLDGKDGWLGRCLCTQTWVLYLDKFPEIKIDTPPEKRVREEGITLPLTPVSSVTSLKYRDLSGTLQTMSSTKYKLSQGSVLPLLMPVFNFDWPETLEDIEVVEIEFVCGYGEPKDVPAPIKHAITMMVEEMYNNRGETIPLQFVTQNMTAQRLLAPYRVYKDLF